MVGLSGQMKLPEDLQTLQITELEELAAKIRRYMIQTVANNGGHLAPNLGVVELALALHSTFQSPRDRIIWDVGHQSYPLSYLPAVGSVFIPCAATAG